MQLTDVDLCNSNTQTFSHAINSQNDQWDKLDEVDGKIRQRKRILPEPHAQSTKNQILHFTFVLNFIVAVNNWHIGPSNITKLCGHIPTSWMQPWLDYGTNKSLFSDVVNITNCQRHTVCAQRPKASRIQTVVTFKHVQRHKKSCRITKFGTTSSKYIGGRHSNNRRNSKQKAEKEKMTRKCGWFAKYENKARLYKKLDKATKFDRRSLYQLRNWQRYLRTTAELTRNEPKPLEQIDTTWCVKF